MIKRMFLPLLLAAAVAGTAGAQKISLKKGQKLETVTSTKMSMDVMGQSMENENTATSAIELKEVNTDGYLFSNTIKRMTLKGSAMGQDINFDSDKKEDMDGQTGQALKDHIGVEQNMQVDKQGKIVSVTGSGENKPGPDMASMMNMSEGMAKGQPFPVLIQLPAKSIKPGDSWTDSSGTAATVKLVTTYTLKGIAAGEVMVSFNGTMAKTGAIEQSGMQIQMDISGTTKGEAIYEEASGLLKNNSSTTTMKGTLGIMGQDAPIAATVTANVVVKKI